MKSMLRKYKALLVIAAIVVAGMCLIWVYFGVSDARATQDFTAAYKQYDQAVTSLSGSLFAANFGETGTSNNIERQADEALADLTRKASVRISSLTKNDGEMMKSSLEIADLAAKEIAALKEYRSALADGSADSGRFGTEFTDLQNQRKAAYHHYLDLAGVKE